MAVSSNNALFVTLDPKSSHTSHG